MADVKQILVVDDHFEMLEFLRSMLELSSQEYQVLGVPSAEEGFLELRRVRFDLLITDLRLPGMSGFDLVRKVKQSNPDMPIIMITGYSSEQGRKEAAELGVFRYFQKPLDTDSLLATVHEALYGVTTAVAADATLGMLTVPAEAVKRLEMLRADTGARTLVLGSAQGAVFFETGDSRNLNLAQLGSTIAHTMTDSFLLADQLGSDEPFTIQYQAGQRVDLYTANVGRHYFLAIFFDAESRRGRIGTIWVFAQRAIKDLLLLLPAPAAALPEPALATTTRHHPPTPAAAPQQAAIGAARPSASARRQPSRAISQSNPTIVEARQPASSPARDGRTPVAAPEMAAPKTAAPEMVASEPAAPEAEAMTEATVTAVLPLTEAQLQSISLPAASDVDLDAFWDAAVTETAVALDDAATDGEGLLSLNEAQSLVDFEFEVPPAPVKVDLDSFWHDALATESDGGFASGFSWEEAQAQGLIPPDLDKA
jgi:DNA-binding response OmpR family regulator